jgi:hypothetical protein
MPDLSENAQMMLGAYAMADTHTLSQEAVLEMSQGAITECAVRIGLKELADASLAQEQSDGGYRLTKDGIGLTLQMQEALSSKNSEL